VEINNIVIASPMFKEIEELVTPYNIHKNFRFFSDDEVTQNDLIWADAFVSFNMKGDFDYNHLKWVHSLGAGVDRFLFDRSWPESVLLTRTVCSFGQRIAEYSLSYVLRDIQLHHSYQTLQLKKQWKPMTPGLLSSQKLMVYGTGEIGQRVAKVFSQFGAEVYGVSLSGKQKEYFHQVMTLEDHYDHLSDMNYLINTLPLTKQTFGLFAKPIFDRLSGAGFINVGRGASLNETALLGALNQQSIRFAVLDVFAEEPLPTENELWNHKNIIVTPHISAVTTAKEGVDCFLETLNKIEKNEPLNNIVDTQRGY